MFKSFLGFLERIGRKRVIMDRDGIHPYLIRYYVFLKDRTWFPINVFLHNFLRSDPDHPHDHPWVWGTLILKGGYWEWIPKCIDNNIIGEIRIWRGPGTIRFKSAKSYHRIEIEPNVDCWTLFMTGPRIREWGFLTHKNWNRDTFKWIRFDQYIDKRNNT
jgi:hypothetical protein